MRYTAGHPHSIAKAIELMRLIPLAALTLVSLSTLAIAQSTASEPAFSADGVKRHVEVLAADAMQGRDAGTPGYDRAAAYVAAQYKALGLEPANAGDWYQQVPFVESSRAAAADGGVTIGRQRFADGKDAFVSIIGEGAQRWAGETVFVGYGIKDEKLKRDDYAGLDVKGKTVVMLYGTPKGLPSDVAASLNSGKARMAEAAGATGIITIVTPDMAKRFPPAMMRGEMNRPELRTAAADGTPYRTTPGIRQQALLLDAPARALFAGAPKPLRTVFADAAANRPIKGFALKPRVELQASAAWRRFSSPNVVGMIPGSDPALKDEYVLLMAHLDHNGVDPNAPGPDKIWNGAMDNAAGVATMLEVARAFEAAGTRPKRPILFAAVTAEEDGLLGSDYLARNPLPGRKVVAVVNLDMPVLLYDFTDVTAFGAEHSTMGPLVAAAAQSAGVKLSPDPMPEENLFTRSDHYSFVKQGVPSVFLVTGFANGGDKAFQSFLSTHYHKPSDDLKLPFDWNAGAKFARVNYAIARSLADAPAAPLWYADSPFADRFAKDRPKATRPAK